MNNNTYQRNYIPNYNQNMYEDNLSSQIDNQINQLVTMRNQLRNNAVQNNQQQQPAINQTFQLSPNNNGGIKYVNSLEDVSKEIVFFDTPFFSKDLTVMWLKNASGDIKAYELSEIIQKDEKDMQIELLQAELDELKGMIKNEWINTNDDEAKNTENTSTSNESTRKSVKKNQSSSISRISKSKTE